MRANSGYIRHMDTIQNLKKNSFLFVIPLLTGVSAGVFSTVFLKGLYQVTQVRESHSWLIFGLPLFGLILAYIIKKIPNNVNEGVSYLLGASTDESRPISIWMAPYILISSLGTHLFGGSAGREGVGVIMGISLGQIFSKFSNSLKGRGYILIYSGIAAGFSSIFGTPLAAIIFSYELHQFKRVKNIPLFICTALSSIVAYYVTHILGLTHTNPIVNFDVNGTLLIYIILTALLSGLGARLFYYSIKYYTLSINKLLPSLAARFFIGALAISLLIYFGNFYEYTGIGVDFINESFHIQRDPADFIIKFILTVMTLSIGFKGGEVTPLFFMGSALCNSLLAKIGFINYALSSALGMITFFAAASAAPFASAVMASEIFGYQLFIPSLASSYLARLLMGNKSIYAH